VGALAIKNSVYALPDLPDCLEDFQWIAQEAARAGGDASICRAGFVEGISDAALVERFRAAADERLAPLSAALKHVLAEARRTRGPHTSGHIAAFAKLRKQVDDALRTDFFAGAGSGEVQKIMKAIEAVHHPASKAGHSKALAADLVGSVWVTRRDAKVDRLSTAWLIRRFVDPAARFRFVDPEGGAARAGERTFDMVGADFGHDGDRCTFETMVARLGLTEPGLGAIAEIVHDLDLKDGKFGRPEAAGIRMLITGLVHGHPESSARLTAALPIFDTLFQSFGGSRAPVPARTPRRAKGRAR
jgi:hypothetical protein